MRRQEKQRGENEKLNLVSIDAILAFAACPVLLFTFIVLLCVFWLLQNGRHAQKDHAAPRFFLFLFFVFIITLTTTSSLFFLLSPLYFSFFFFSHKRDGFQGIKGIKRRNIGEPSKNTIVKGLFQTHILFSGLSEKNWVKDTKDARFQSC